MGDDFPAAVKDILAKRVRAICSRPGCGQVTSGPQLDPAKAVNVGAAAHITAASPDGPRYDPALTAEQRRSHENGIWLCQTCAKMVDNDSVRFYEQLLRAWKVIAEDNAARVLEGLPDTSLVATFERLERLMPALLAEMRQDLADNPSIRECILMDGGVYNGGGVFIYQTAQHPDLEGRFHILENLGLVRNVTRTNATRYRIAEDLAKYLGG